MPYVQPWHSMPVVKFFTALSAALTLATVYAPVTDSSACTMISASAKPIWLKLPTPPETEWPYWARIALYSAIFGVLVTSGGVSSALTNSLRFHFGPSALARKSVLHGVEQPHILTRSSRPSFCAACRITSASGGVKLRITAPFGPASSTSLIATELASEIGTFSVSCTIGTCALLASAAGPAAMYPVPGTFDWSKTILETCCASAYCTAPSELYRGPMLTAALFEVE